MNRDSHRYLAPLLARDPLPLGELVYLATGELYPGGAQMTDILADLEALCSRGVIRMEHRHSPRHRRIERTVHLTAAGRRACAGEGDAPWNP